MYCSPCGCYCCGDELVTAVHLRGDDVRMKGAGVSGGEGRSSKVS